MVGSNPRLKCRVQEKQGPRSRVCSHESRSNGTCFRQFVNWAISIEPSLEDAVYFKTTRGSHRRRFGGRCSSLALLTSRAGLGTRFHRATGQLWPLCRGRLHRRLEKIHTGDDVLQRRVSSLDGGSVTGHWGCRHDQAHDAAVRGVPKPKIRHRRVLTGCCRHAPGGSPAEPRNHGQDHRHCNLRRRRPTDLWCDIGREPGTCRLTCLLAAKTTFNSPVGPIPRWPAAILGKEHYECVPGDNVSVLKSQSGH
jgi:hypothetical protein